MELFLRAFVILSATLFSLKEATSSGIALHNNGYEGIVIALPPQTGPRERPRIVSNLQLLLEQSSKILAASTKDRASFRSATFLVPPEWGTSWFASFEDNVTSFREAGAALARDSADIFVTHSERADHPYTLHHETCTHEARRIYLPARFLLEDASQEKGVEFLRLWSEFRYGMFPEGGFEHDVKYPDAYRTPGEGEDKVTGCSAQNSGIPYECAEKTQCIEDGFTSSLMDQHLPTSATFFCEGEFSLGPAHNPHSPSKQNLLCREEGTWFTLMRSQDFAQGKNPAPKHKPDTEMKFQFVQEVLSPKIVVLIETSAKMNFQSRYALIKNAFSRFVYTTLPAGSELSLLTFSGESGVELLKASLRLNNDQAKIQFLEAQPLPEDPSTDETACVDCALHHIFELTERNDTDLPPSPVVILVTAQCSLSPAGYPGLRQRSLDREIRFHVLSLGDCEGDVALETLSRDTGGRLIHIGGDVLGDLYKGFDAAVYSRRKEIVTFQEYLSTEDEELLSVSFNIENRMFERVRVYISGEDFDSAPLVFEKTGLSCPHPVRASFRKQEVLPAWIFDADRPAIGGTYTLTTERKRGATSPILITVTVQQLNSEDQINVRVWTELFHAAEISPPPIRIFSEVRKGNYPVAGAYVSAQVLHPDGEMSEFVLIDDGLGNVDMTEGDGVYSHFFTNFTSSGFYNVYIKAREGLNDSEAVEIRGPDGHCCGTSFGGTVHAKTGPFQRESGPVTFHVSTVPRSDVYPPSRVTDLSLADNFDEIYVLNWTAVGDDYDSGVASEYELKLFPDRTVLRHRFSGSDSELYAERIKTTPLAEYGRPLVHALRLPRMRAAGRYYFAVRAVDEAGNAGEPSNALPVWVEQARNRSGIDCEPEETPKPEKHNVAAGFLPAVSLILWMVVLRHL